MRIDDHNLTGAAATEAGRTPEIHRAGHGSGPGAKSATGGDRVELSSTLGSLSRALEAHQTDRAARVQELAAQHQAGRYRPDAAAISRAMTAEALAPATA